MQKFELSESGRFTAEITADRLQTKSFLDSVLTLYRETGDPGAEVREIIARNDDYFGEDAFLDLELEAGIYYLAVTSVGNTEFDPTVSDSGYGGRTDGAYTLDLNFTPNPDPDLVAEEFMVDTDGVALDGDADGKPGGVFDFWFTASTNTNTFFVDKTAPSTGANGSLTNPYNNIKVALDEAKLANDAAADTIKIVRIVGNGFGDDVHGTPSTFDNNEAYLVGLDDSFQPLEDGGKFDIPKDVTVMIDAGTIIKLQNANIDVGSNDPLLLNDRSGGALQILGTPENQVYLTSYGNDDLGGDDDGLSDGANAADWGGIVFRADSDLEDSGVFLNSVNNADISFGGGNVFVNSVLQTFSPIHAESARPTIWQNTIHNNADSAISADPRSFEDSRFVDGSFIMDRYGLEIFDNQIYDNSINGLFVRINTDFGSTINKLDVPAIFNDDITHVITENLQIYGAPGGQLVDGSPSINGRLKIDPGIVVKLSGARIEAERGSAQFIAEGTEANPIIFTSLSDDRYGAGTTFDTSNDGVTAFGPGNWGGIIFNAASSGSIDHALITNAGGLVPIEGELATFNAIEVHQAEFRISNSILEDNASGQTGSNRNGRGNNDSATIFVRGAQPIIVDNIFRDNAGTVISIDANSLDYKFKSDYGRSTGFTDAYQQYPDNHGALVRLNRMDNNGLNGMEVRGALLDTETIWDDTDIVHILRGEILVNQHHTFSGIRLQSNIGEGLVVKLAGPTAGFTAAGVPLDIDDRIGGTVQIIGQPGFPVVLTSLADDTVGASFTPAGFPQTDTNNNGASTPSAGDWRSIRLDRYSNDRNVVVRFETEGNNTNGIDVNNTPGFAQNLGVLAPDQISGDENRALGFEVHGSISADAPDDVDVYSFNATAGTEIWIDIDRTSSALDSVVELVNIFGEVIASSLDSFDPTTLFANPAIIANSAIDDLKLTKTDHLLGDFYSQNKGDAGFRVILPGPAGAVGTFFVRVRSQPETGSEADVTAGETSGQYQLQVRLRQVDEKPGSTVRYADIRYATNGIEVLGQPSHSPLLGESSEKTGTNETIDTAQGLGNLLTSDRNTLAVSGTLSGDSDVDWYTFEMGFDLIQVVGGRSDGAKTFSTIFDIDYADGLTRGDTTLSVFDDQGRLVLISRDSNIEDDLANNDTEDLSSGSFGTFDPYIGSTQLPAATPGTTFRYHVAISSNARLPQALNATFNSGALNSQIRLEPVSSVQRIVEDHIGFNGYTSGNELAGSTFVVAPTTSSIFDITDTTTLATNVTAFTLADVNLYISEGNRLRIADAYDGRVVDSVGGVSAPSNTIDIGALSTGTPTTSDITIRSDGKLYSYENLPGVANTAGRLRELNAGTGATVASFNDGIPNTLAAPAFNDPVRLTTDSVGALAFRRTGVATYNLYYAVNDGNISTLYQGNPANGDAGDNKSVSSTNPADAGNQFTVRGDIRVSDGGTGFLDIGNVTGLAFKGINATNQSQLYGVTEDGYFLTINRSTGLSIGVDLSGATIDLGLGRFAGLTAAPQNLNNGAFQDYLFAITNTGNLFAIDPATGIILTEVTDSDPNVGTIDIFAGGGTSINVGASGVTGLAFSPLDFNLWHPTFRQNSEAGHGINNTFDQTRTDVTGNGRESFLGSLTQNEQQGGASFYFGFEEWLQNNSSTNDYIDYVGNAQYGVLSSAFQQDLSTNTTIGDNYNIAGGAHGTLETSTPFSLAGYSGTDLPTLYFNYFLESQSANSISGGMRDSARVFITNDDGATWTELATNNSTLAPPTDAGAGELSTYITTSAREDRTGNPNQRVQELFDNTGVWRQARVDLGTFAGDANLRLRFDFSTSGTISSDIDMPGDIFGNILSNQQAQNNDFEGFYIDDIIIGFAERGELVTGAQTDQTDFFNVPQNPTFGAPTQLLSGAYQLEIRRGTDYAAPPNDQLPDLTISTQFDTNDRLIREAGRLGDRNLERQQGHISIELNTITSSSEYAINIDAGLRESVAAGPNGETSLRSQAGGVINGPTLNNFFAGGLGFAPGVTVQNNVLSDFTNGSGGLRVSGDTNNSTANNPAAVSYTKVVNNTIVGTNNAGEAGQGILVENFATTTILNNIIAYTSTGIDIQSATGIPNVVGANLFKLNGDNGTLGSNPIELTLAADELFADAAAGNFYLADNSKAIDSSLNSLSDRVDFVNVKDAIGMPNSDIFAPTYDTFGQLRVDDPSQSPPPGLGSNIFKDRGAIERADFVGPTAVISLPPDNEMGVDFNSNLNEVYVESPELFTTMIITLRDTGIGIDDAVVNSTQFTLTAETSSSLSTLVEGVDYVFSYNSNTNEAIFTSIAGVFSLDTLYTVTVENTEALGGVKDLAGNLLQPNQGDGSTSFIIVVTDGVNDPPVNLINGTSISGDDPITPMTGLVETESETAFTFIGANALTVADSDAFLAGVGNDFVEVTLTAVRGTLTLGSTTNVMMTNGLGLGGEATFTFKGLLADVNDALKETIFQPESGFYTSNTMDIGPRASVTIYTDDLGNFTGAAETDSDVINITVLDPPTVQFSSAIYTVTETDGITTTTLDVTLTRDKSGAVSTVLISDLLTGSAVSGVDYATFAANTLVSFAANDLQTTFSITINGDDIVEADETINFEISSVQFNALIDPTGQNTAEITIDDNDQAVLNINTVTQFENVNLGVFTFTASLTKLVDANVTVDVMTEDGTADVIGGAGVGVGNNDYTFFGNTITINQLMNSIEFTVMVTADDIVELDEYFDVIMDSLSLNSGGLDVVLGTNGKGNILNDDSALLSIVGETRSENDEEIIFTLSLDKQVAGDIDLFASILDGNNTTDPFIGNATLADTDYSLPTPTNPEPITIMAGSTMDTFKVTVLKDEIVELDEELIAILSGLDNHGFDVDFVSGQPTEEAIGTIENDDQATFTIEPFSSAGVLEQSGQINFRVTMDREVDYAVTIMVNTMDGTAKSIMGGVLDSEYDYDPLTNYSILFNPGETQKFFFVDVNDDNIVELDETFTVEIGSTIVAGGRDVVLGTTFQATGTILNDDSATLSINTVSRLEEDNMFTFTASLSAPVDTAITFDASPSEATPVSALSGTDFDDTLHSLMIGAEELIVEFDVMVVDDNIVELDEQFKVLIQNLMVNLRTTVTGGVDGIGIIRNSDSAQILIGDRSQSEEDGPMEFTVTLTAPVDVPVTFNISTQDGNSTNPLFGNATVVANDYTQIIDQPFTFAALNTTAQPFIVSITDDDIVELDEIFNVIMGSLSSSGRLVSLGGDAQGKIQNTDSATISINNVSQLESDGEFVFTATLSQPVDTSVSVEVYTETPVTSIHLNDADYDAIPSGMPLMPLVLTFDPTGPLTQQFTVTVNDDNIVEGDEIFNVILDNLMSATAGVSLVNDASNPAEGVILNDDSATFTITPVIDTEDNSPFDFLIELSNPVDVEIQVDANTINGSAISPDDFILISGPLRTLTFIPNQTQQHILVQVEDDATPEGPETFQVELSNLTISVDRDVSLTKFTDISSTGTTDAAIAVKVVNDLAYIADRDGGLQIYNVGTPSSPVFVGSYDLSHLGITQGIDVVGNYAYLAVGSGGLQILDISNPSSPTLVSSYATTARARGVQVIGDRAYVTDDSSSGGGLQIIDLTNLTSSGLVTLVDTFIPGDPGGLAGGVKVIGNIAYLTDGNNGLRIVNVDETDVDFLTQIAQVATPDGAAIGLDVVGDYAYVANREGGLQIININTLSRLDFDIPGVATGVRVEDGKAYVASGTAGLVVVDVSVPTDPKLLNTFDTPGSARSLHVILPQAGTQAGVLAYVADTFSGLQIVEFFTTTTATGTILDPGGAPLTGTASANTTISTSLVSTPTSTDVNGETDSVPESEQWIDEWDSFWVEVWGTTTDGSGISGGTFDLKYNTDFFTATAVEFGSVFGNSHSSSIDDLNGIVSAISGQNNIGTLGSGNQVLLGRVKFESLSDDGVDIDTISGFLGPHNLGIQVVNAQLDISDFGGVTASVAQSPTTDLWAVPFDLDDNGSINFRDLMTFASYYGTSVIDTTSGLAWSLDFDKSGQINFRDLTYFASNYGRTKASGQQITFPANFPKEWYGSSITTEGNNTLTDLIDSAVDEWKTATGNDDFAVQVVVTDLGGQQLGEGHILELDENGVPVKGRIFIDDDAAGLGWYSSIEGLAFDANGQATAGSAAEGHYDLHTVLLHEIGHAAGFNTGYSAFSDHVQTNNSGQVQFVGSGVVAPLENDGQHLDASFYPNDLMGHDLDPSSRKMISTLDVQILQAVYANAAGAVIVPISPPLMATAVAPVSNTTNTTRSVKKSVRSSAISPATVQPSQTVDQSVSQESTVISEQQPEWNLAPSFQFRNSVMSTEPAVNLDQLVGSLLDNSYETEQIPFDEFGKIRMEDSSSRFDFAHDFELEDVVDNEVIDEEFDNQFADWSGPLV